ncbi:hypothetical protein G3I60_20145 [Streptomyces sp. SID13666]|uniref:hypothetical protein n=1 Tax=Streptomyces sp. SID13666 TaxID=2706054 RepID=UPI0013C01CBA|nr:hypothetical protein [Streptomyces sp. SID13666]NEA56393.1 hypothetical protein [Streptomyces sp. SID13666]
MKETRYAFTFHGLVSLRDADSRDDLPRSVGSIGEAVDRPKRCFLGLGFLDTPRRLRYGAHGACVKQRRRQEEAVAHTGHLWCPVLLSPFFGQRVWDAVSVTSTAWLDIGIVIFGLAAGALINWLVQPAKLGQKAIVICICLTVSIVLLFTVIKDLPSDEPQIDAIKCARLFDQAHDRLDKQSELAAPPLAGFVFTPSQEVPGRIDLTLTWINPIPIHQSAVALQGVYGQAVPNDDFIDHKQPAAATGECWNWYHFGPRDDAQPKTVRLRVSGLWPEQQYCFYTEFRTDKGYSKPTTIRCVRTTWKSEWGTPAQAPTK